MFVFFSFFSLYLPFFSFSFFSSVVCEVFVFGLFLSFRELECFIILPCVGHLIALMMVIECSYVCMNVCVVFVCVRLRARIHIFHCVLASEYTIMSICVDTCVHVSVWLLVLCACFFFNVNYCVLGDKLWNCLFFFISLCAALTLIFIFAMMLICVYVYVRISTHVYVYFCVVVFAFWWHISDASHLFLCSNNFSVILKSYLYSLFNFNNVIYS